MLYTWWGTGFISIIAQNKYFDYHFLALWGPAASLLGIATASVARRTVHGWVGATILGVSSLGLVLLTPVRERWIEGAPVLLGASLNDFWAAQREFRYRDWSVDDQRVLVEHLRATTTPEDRVFIWGFEPAVNVWSQRRTVSRFLYNYPFRVDFSNPAYEVELLAALRGRPPEVFVVVKGDATYGVTGNMLDSAALLGKRPQLQAFVDAHYDSSATVRRYRVHRLRRGAR